MDDRVESEWESEDIPDEDWLYYRIHRTWLRNGQISANAFQDRGGSMSTNWSRYSSLERTREEVREMGKTPEDNAVVMLNVGNVRSIKGQSVMHTPQRFNRAHTDVRGEKNLAVRVELLKLCEMALPLPN